MDCFKSNEYESIYSEYLELNSAGALVPVTDNTVIYVKEGPVRVHGKYKGRYTVGTDEYTTYRRHAWPEPSSPLDTIWNNIWITKDLINVDAIGFSSGYPVYSEDGNLEEFQPGSVC